MSNQFLINHVREQYGFIPKVISSEMERHARTDFNNQAKLHEETSKNGKS